MNGAFLAIGIIFIALGLVGLASNYHAGWMWVFIILGVLSVIWGWLIYTPKSPKNGKWQS